MAELLREQEAALKRAALEEKAAAESPTKAEKSAGALVQGVETGMGPCGLTAPRLTRDDVETMGRHIFGECQRAPEVLFAQWGWIEIIETESGYIARDVVSGVSVSCRSLECALQWATLRCPGARR